MVASQWLFAAALIAAAPLLGGCNTTGPSLKSAEAGCMAQYPTYREAWNCARGQTNVSPAEYRTRYFANGDALLLQVNNGQMSDASAYSFVSPAAGTMGGSDGGTR